MKITFDVPEIKIVEIFDREKRDMSADFFSCRFRSLGQCLGRFSLTLVRGSVTSSVVCRSSLSKDALQGSRYLPGQAHRGCVKFSLTYTALQTC